MTLRIDDSLDMTRAFVDEALNDLSQASFKVHSAPCPHCGVHVRYPLIARKCDIDDFAVLMKAASAAMMKFGITGNLLAEIKANIAIAIAKRANKGNGDE